MMMNVISILYLSFLLYLLEKKKLVLSEGLVVILVVFFVSWVLFVYINYIVCLYPINVKTAEPIGPKFDPRECL